MVRWSDGQMVRWWYCNAEMVRWWCGNMKNYSVLVVATLAPPTPPSPSCSPPSLPRPEEILCDETGLTGKYYTSYHPTTTFTSTGRREAVKSTQARQYDDVLIWGNQIVNIDILIWKYSHGQVDTLEIVLHELLDIVDFIFLVEATKSHKGVSIE